MQQSIIKNDTLCGIKLTSNFKKSYKKISKSLDDKVGLLDVILQLANKKELDSRYRNHRLLNDKYYKDCYECHVKPDLLLIYKYIDNDLVLLLVDVGSHSYLF